MTVKKHYDEHLSNFYSWMIGDFEKKQKEFQSFLKKNKIHPYHTKTAIDLGAGHGIQSISLSKIGFNVIAIDFNKKLLEELELNSRNAAIKIVNDDIRNVSTYNKEHPELILCCGDTLTHLESKEEIQMFIKNCITSLIHKGKMILSFRDYTTELIDQKNCIPVKSDENRILTCILDYEPEKVKVTDLLHEKINDEWKQKVSSYYKVRVSPFEIEKIMKDNGMNIIFHESIHQMHTIIAEKE
ncbi:class I SAM-dependent methyltransferase [Aquimarina rhabdastrellae]